MSIMQGGKCSVNTYPTGGVVGQPIVFELDRPDTVSTTDCSNLYYGMRCIFGHGAPERTLRGETKKNVDTFDNVRVQVPLVACSSI